MKEVKYKKNIKCLKVNNIIKNYNINNCFSIINRSYKD